jgi:hypothetical protein
MEDYTYKSGDIIKTESAWSREFVFVKNCGQDLEIVKGEIAYIISLDQFDINLFYSDLKDDGEFLIEDVVQDWIIEKEYSNLKDSEAFEVKREVISLVDALKEVETYKELAGILMECQRDIQEAIDG